jgi:adenylyl cyclase-associated protein
VRLERIVERLERSISQRDFDTSQKLLNTALTTASTSVETVRELRAGNTDSNSEDDNNNNLPTVLSNFEKQINEQNLNQTQEKSEDTLSIDENIPTVIHQIEIKDPSKQEKTTVNNMSVNAYEDIMLGALATYLEKSAKIGDDVATQADFVKKAFDAQFAYIKMASESAAPDQSTLQSLLKPTSDQIMAIQTFREKHRTSKFFNHLSAISESIPALGWVCVSPTPGPHVKEMNDAGQFYTNRVLKEWKEKDATHVDWCRSWIQTLTELQQYIKQYHTTGLVWAGKNKATASACAPPPPPPGGMPPPPPMIPADFSAAPAGGDDRSALFAQINQGADITKNLKKVTADMQTHKNPNLRSGPAPYKAPAPLKSGVVEKPAPVAKPPSFYQEGKKWIIEYQKNNPNLIVQDAEMNNVVYMFRSENSTLNVKGKINSIQVDSCKKCNIIFESLVSSVEFVNCEKIQMQVLGKVPTISIDKTDGCQMYLSKDSLNVEIVSSKSSEMNVMLPTPDGEDYTELAIPEQYKTTISGNSLQTVCNESLG